MPYINDVGRTRMTDEPIDMVEIRPHTGQRSVVLNISGNALSGDRILNGYNLTPEKALEIAKALHDSAVNVRRYFNE